jgi:hypothetical protein
VHVHLTPTALAKAKALGIVAAALSAGGAGGVVALSQVANTSTTAVTVANATGTPSPTDSPTASPTEAPVASPSGAAADVAATPTSTAFVLPSCPADVKNHGAYVSSVARSAPKGAEGEHGKWVSQAAQSDCGKPTPGASGSPDAQDSPESEVPDTESPKPARTTSPTTGHHASSHKHHGHGHSG